MIPLDLSFGQSLWLSLPGNIVAILAVVIGLKNSKDSRVSAEKQAVAAREASQRQTKDALEASERQTTGTLKHASDEARTARLVARREDLYVDVIRLLRELSDLFNDAPQLGNDWVDPYEKLVNRFPNINDRMMVFGVRAAHEPLASARKMATRMKVDARNGDFTDLARRCREFDDLKEGLIETLRSDLGNRT